MTSTKLKLCRTIFYKICFKSDDFGNNQVLPVPLKWEDYYTVITYTFIYCNTRWAEARWGNNQVEYF